MKIAAQSPVLCLLCSLMLFALALPAVAQQESVKPGINDSYKNVDLEDKIRRFENNSRDVVRNSQAVIDACELAPGLIVADVGAGTGLFTRLFAPKVAPGGKVYAVDITKKFLDHVEKSCAEQQIKNVTCVHCTDRSTKLPDASVDMVFTCNTYHHFEYPYDTLASIHKALRPGGRLIIIDFEREKGLSPDWIFGHVRAGKKTVIKEVTDAGFKLIDEPDIMKLQYLLRFQKVEK